MCVLAMVHWSLVCGSEFIPQDNFQWDLPQSDKMQDLICHIQNDSFFTSSSRQIEERGKVISLCTTTPFLQSLSCHRAMSRAQGGTGQMLLGNSTPLVGRALQAEHRRGTRGEWDRGTPGCLFVSGPVRNDTTQALVVAVKDRQQSLFCWVGE